MTQESIREKQTSRNIALLFLALIPALLLLFLSWSFTGTPQGDGYIQELFTVLYYQDAGSLSEKISNTWWSYTQHRAVVSKIIVLLIYFLSGYINLQIVGVIGSLSLCGIIYLFSMHAFHKNLNTILIPITSLIILSPYFWSIITCPEATIFYYGTIFLSFLCFYLLDKNKPQIILAMLCSWLATLTMANGILSIAIASLIITHQQIIERKYQKWQIILWITGSLACAIFHTTTTNVFSPDVYGAKPLSETLAGINGRLIDFFESMGAVPLPTHRYREEKILLGLLITGLVAYLAYPRRSYTSLSVTGLMLFSTATLLLTSLFRYSTGDNDGFQVFTTTNIAAVLILGISQTNQNKWLLTTTFVTAVALNINGILANIQNMENRNSTISKKMETFLITGKSQMDNWTEVITQDSIRKNIFRPLSSHSILKNAKKIEKASECNVHTAEQPVPVKQITTSTAFAKKISANIPMHEEEHEDLSLLLCSQKINYRIYLSNKNISSNNNHQKNLTVLLDKRLFTPGEYTAFIETPTKTIPTDRLISIAAVEYPDRTAYDCAIMHKTFDFKQKAFSPMINYYCSNKQN